MLSPLSHTGHGQKQSLEDETLNMALCGMAPRPSSLSFQPSPSLWGSHLCVFFQPSAWAVLSLLPGLCPRGALCPGHPSLTVHLVNSYTALSWLTGSALVWGMQKPPPASRGQAGEWKGLWTGHQIPTISYSSASVGYVPTLCVFPPHLSNTLSSVVLLTRAHGPAGAGVVLSEVFL